MSSSLISGSKITKATLKALRWFSKQSEPVGWFDAAAPSQQMLKKLEVQGLIERAGKEPGVFGVSKFKISAAGLEALKEKDTTSDD